MKKITKTIQMMEKTKKTIISNCEHFKEDVLEIFEIDCYLIVKKSDGKSIHYKGYIQYEDGYTSTLHVHTTLDECLVDCIACKYENTSASHATPYIMRMIGMERGI